AVELDELAALGHVVHRVPVIAKLAAVLVEIGDLQARAVLDAAAVGPQLPQQQAQQGGLAAAVGADQADAVAAFDDRAEVVDQPRFAARMAEAQVLGDDHALAALRRIVLLDAHIALQFTPLGALATQRLQCADAALVARAPRLDALANPDFLGGEALVETGVLLGLGMQPLLATAQVVLPVTRPHR